MPDAVPGATAPVPPGDGETVDRFDTHRAEDGGATAPGSTDARERGCICSVLGNAAYRVGAAERPLIDPDCAIH